LIQFLERFLNVNHKTQATINRKMCTITVHTECRNLNVLLCVILMKYVFVSCSQWLICPLTASPAHETCNELNCCETKSTNWVTRRAEKNILLTETASVIETIEPYSVLFAKSQSFHHISQTFQLTALAMTTTSALE